MKKVMALLMTTMMIGGLVGCGGSKTEGNNASSENEYKVAMVTDTGGVNDQSFNQSSWEGLQSFEKNNQGGKVSYTESKQESDYATNLDKAVDSGNKLVWETVLGTNLRIKIGTSSFY